VFGAQYYILEQQGFRKLVDTTFIMGFLVREDAVHDDLERYFRALRRAQREIDLEPDRYKHFWLRELPDDLSEGVDVRRFGPGERMVFEPYTREMYERTHRWMESWQLFDAQTAPRPDYASAVIAYTTSRYVMVPAGADVDLSRLRAFRGYIRDQAGGQADSYLRSIP
jgi:NitT/TauT family transport system substrate-binding protein